MSILEFATLFDMVIGAAFRSLNMETLNGHQISSTCDRSHIDQEPSRRVKVVSRNVCKVHRSRVVTAESFRTTFALDLLLGIVSCLEHSLHRFGHWVVRKYLVGFGICFVERTC